MLGAGAASLACAKFYLLLGARRENIVMVDREGVVRKGEVDGIVQPVFCELVLVLEGRPDASPFSSRRAATVLNVP